MNPDRPALYLGPAPRPAPEPSLPRRLLRSPLAWGGLGVLLLALAGALLLFFRSRGPDYEFASATFQNAAGGYEFRHPPEWRPSADGTATRLRTRDRRLVVLFGLGAEGELDEASTALIQQVERSYRSVRFSGATLDDIGERRALLVGGTARNQRGVALRIVAVTIEGEDRNYSIVAFLASGAEHLFPRLNEVVESFRV